MEVRVLTSNLESFIPNEAVYTQFRCEVELDEVPFALVVGECESVDTKALHHAVGSRNRSVGHGPKEHVG
jgi:hypothetical protein